MYLCRDEAAEILACLGCVEYINLMMMRMMMMMMMMMNEFALTWHKS